MGRQGRGAGSTGTWNMASGQGWRQVAWSGKWQNPFPVKLSLFTRHKKPSIKRARS